MEGIPILCLKNLLPFELFIHEEAVYAFQFKSIQKFFKIIFTHITLQKLKLMCTD